MVSNRKLICVLSSRRHLLSADTKDERVRWSRDFNKALMLVRSWGMGSASGTFQ